MPHTVPNRPMNGADEPMVASTSSLDFQPLDLALDGDVEHLVDALGEPGTARLGALEGALPLAHGGDEHGGHAAGRPVGERAVELLQRLAGPEHLLEAVHRPCGCGE